MATPKRKQPTKRSQDGATRSREKAQKRKRITSATIMKSHRLSKETGVQPKRRSTMTTEHFKERADEARKVYETSAEDMGRIGEAFARAASTFDLKGMSNAWKLGYLRGLEAVFQSQEQTHHFVKETVKQGINGAQQMLQSYDKCLDDVQGKAGTALPFVELSRQFMRSVQHAADPLYKTAADTTESAFNYYEDSLARPSRQYAIDLNKRVLDTIITA